MNADLNLNSPDLASILEDKINNADRTPHEGMPPMDRTGPATSLFEFWPNWLFYAPVKLYIAWLALRYGGATLPSVANPTIKNGGMIGESKDQIYSIIPKKIREKWFLKQIAFKKRGDSNVAIEATLNDIETQMHEAGLAFPVVIKPDEGARGGGIQLLRNKEMLERYIRRFDHDELLILQELANYEGEVGLFYIRMPGEEKGRITSLTLKYFPYIYGDGQSTIRELIMADERAGKIAHLYLDRNTDKLDYVLSDGEPYRLVFSGSHCRGTIFKNGAELINDAMTKRFDEICRAIPELYFCRMDIRFRDFSDLYKGKDMKIIEINGASAEATHIWDNKMSLLGAYVTLFTQYRKLYQIGAKNRARGFKPMAFGDAVKAYNDHLKAMDNYPETH